MNLDNKTTENRSEENKSAQVDSAVEAEKKKAAERLKKKKRIEREAFRAKYFSYYDDVKTKIKEDW